MIGDYSLQFGQGLTLWSGFSFAKTIDIATIAKKDLGLRPYTSTGEYSFFRGFSSTIRILKDLDFSPFLSIKKLDASQQLNTDNELVQTSISRTGLHRTNTEISNKNTVVQQLLGGIVQYTQPTLSLGAIVYHNAFSHAFITQHAAYDQFSFTGQSLVNSGIFYNYAYRNFYFFGEGSKSIPGGFAFINGVLMSLTNQLSASATYRNYAKDYHNFYSQALAENAEAINEKGLFTGVNYLLNKKWSVSFYTDIFSFPWLKYRVSAPSSGYEILGQLAYSPLKSFKVNFRYRSKIKQQNSVLTEAIQFLETQQREGYRLDINWQLNKTITFQHRTELSTFNFGNAKTEFGYLHYQDINIKPKKTKLSGNLRLAYFKTDTYNTRIYAYEDDVLYSFGFGMYNGQGIRNYINLKYDLAKKFHIWARYAISIYKDASTVGSYLDEIEGNKKAEVKLQMRYQF